MFLCLDCGDLFSTPKSYSDSHGLDYGAERWNGCPYCSGAYVSTFECSECGEFITGKYVRIGDFKYCDKCFDVNDIEDNY